MFVLTEKYGQLGNRLFLSAHLLAAAIEHGRQLVNLAIDEDAPAFEGTRHDLFCRYPLRRSSIAPRPWLRRLAFRVVRRATRLAARLRLVPPGVALVRHRDVEVDWPLDGPEIAALVRSKRAIFFRGWKFRSEALLAKHADVVRGVFAPIPERASRIDALLSRARAGAEVVVGVHVRRGDYREWLGGRYFYEIDAYARLMARIADLFAGRTVAFLVCSDERLAPAEFPGRAVTIANGDRVDDMYSLARCDYIVGPPSTFSAWGSFHGQVPLYVVRDPNARPALELFSVAG